MEADIIVLQKKDFIELLNGFKLSIIQELDNRFASMPSNKDKVYSITEASKLLKCRHGNVKELVKNGSLKITKNNKVTGESLNIYLKGVKL